MFTLSKSSTDREEKSRFSGEISIKNIYSATGEKYNADSNIEYLETDIFEYRSSLVAMLKFFDVASLMFELPYVYRCIEYPVPESVPGSGIIKKITKETNGIGDINLSLGLIIFRGIYDLQIKSSVLYTHASFSTCNFQETSLSTTSVRLLTPYGGVIGTETDYIPWYKSTRVGLNFNITKDFKFNILQMIEFQYSFSYLYGLQTTTEYLNGTKSVKESDYIYNHSVTFLYKNRSFKKELSSVGIVLSKTEVSENKIKIYSTGGNGIEQQYILPKSEIFRVIPTIVIYPTASFGIGIEIPISVYGKNVFKSNTILFKINYRFAIIK